MGFAHKLGGVNFVFDDLKMLLAKATPARSGDELAGIAAGSARERVAAQMALTEMPLTAFLDEAVVPYETDEVTRLIVDSHDAVAFGPVASLTVGEFRDWLLSDGATGEVLAALASGVTPEMAAAVAKLMRVQDMIAVARKIHVVTRFRTTVGLPGRLATRLQPNHPADDPLGIAVSMLDGLRMGSGDAVIGINPVSDNAETVTLLLRMIDHVRRRFAIPTQSCVLAHLTTQMRAMTLGAPVDLLFQSIAGTEAANASFGVSLSLLEEGHAMARAQLSPELAGANVMYFETGQGSALSANAHFGVDQQTLEARAYAVARPFKPMLVNTVVGFIGPEYLYDGKQIVRAGIEDHFAGKLLGLPMGCDVCYTNHAEADGDDMDALLTLLGAAGVNYIMGVPGGDDVMLHYQSTSFQDALYLRRVLGLRPAPEFEAWLAGGGMREVGMAGMLEGFAGVRSLDVGELVRAERLTPARVGLGAVGVSVPTAALLELRRAEAEARDAVSEGLAAVSLVKELTGLGLAARVLKSAARNRAEYLRRPDLGRRLAVPSIEREPCDLAVLVADGLSALAANRQAVPLLRELFPLLEGWKLGPVCMVEQGRVAIGDEIGERLAAEMVLVLIGERPGLSAADSLGAYITWQPKVGRTDAERNCVSNIRPEGLGYQAAAGQIAASLQAGRLLKFTGVETPTRLASSTE